jgi:hypothetical protein
VILEFFRVLRPNTSVSIAEQSKNILCTVENDTVLTCVALGKYSAMFQLDTMSISLSPSELLADVTFCVLA